MVATPQTRPLFLVIADMVTDIADGSKVPILLQKSFYTGAKNSAGRRRGFRVKMRGTSSPYVKLTGDFGKATAVT